MAFEIVWTERAVAGYESIINYLKENFTDNEIVDFVTSSNKFFELLEEHPELLRKTSRQKNIYRGPLNPLTILTYRIKVRKKQIELLNIRSARQKPLR